MKKIIAVLLCLPLFTSAQYIVHDTIVREGDVTGRREDTSTIRRPLTQYELNKVLNRTFSILVSSNPSSGEVATYASLDPINAAFTLKANFPIQPGKKAYEDNKSFEEKLMMESGRISYLSFSLSGGLIDKKYATLFTNSILNAGASLVSVSLRDSSSIVPYNL
ncbi:hypothetical protein OCK74_12050 [Chitinophagaceae bacterium LB-8]|uniref:Uncharacterized protein n=1 Tax=Paraflavisolibacter caeni TaxID=2982496 RepID=A0A9X2XP41_9BACT|nr:hypothetical protein [Paraflavisolibacter caeni]MCU7549854.1 hypothetical protein [Paraflavisolibacter caeni]